MRHSIDQFELFSSQIQKHIVNGYIQEASVKYVDKETYLQLKISEVFDYFIQQGKVDVEKIRKAREIIAASVTYIFLSAREEFEKNKGIFQVLGIDIIFDDDFSPHILEMNPGCYLQVTKPVFQETIRNVVKDYMRLVTYVKQMQEEEREISSEEIMEICVQCTILIDQVRNFTYFDVFKIQDHEPS